MSSQTISAAISELARPYLGVVSRRQMLEAGLGESLIQYRVSSMRLVPIFAGVYSLGHRFLTVQARHAAAVLAGGPCAALSHRSAAAHWGFLKPRGRVEILRTSSPDHPNSKLTGGPNGTSDRLVIHRSRVFNQNEYVVHRGIRTTTVARTFLDLAATMSLRQLESAYTEAERLGLVRIDEMRKVAARGRGWTGVRKLRKLIETWDPRLKSTKSNMEIDFVDLCRDHGIPAPEINIHNGDMEVDCVWQSEMVAVELDSHRFHSSGPAFERDLRKTRKLEKLGYRVLRFSHSMILEESAETATAVLAELRKARSP
ncbi:MAG: DUF559 domain-containing protein [Solirubrobacterales bacterium]